MALRSNRPSVEDRDALGIPDGHKPLAFAHTIHRKPVAATRTALYLPGRVIPWHTVAKAEWAEPFLEIVVTAGPRGELIRLEFEDPGSLPPVIRERVTDSVIISEHRELPNGGGATFAARRLPGDEIAWSVTFDSGVDPTNPVNQAEATHVLAELRSTLGV
ncbi:MAG: hypothetical protein ACKOBJ_01205 [Actinomycetota bacterium]